MFSLGVVLYELLTDVKPFRGESLAQIRDAVLNHEPPLANKVDPAVPKALAAIAARAMAKDPEQRFRSARSFARELRQWLDENPASADGEKTAPSPRRPPRPQPRRRSAPRSPRRRRDAGGGRDLGRARAAAPALADSRRAGVPTRARRLGAPPTRRRADAGLAPSRRGGARRRAGAASTRRRQRRSHRAAARRRPAHGGVASPGAAGATPSRRSTRRPRRGPDAAGPADRRRRRATHERQPHGDADDPRTATRRASRPRTDAPAKRASARRATTTRESLPRPRLVAPATGTVRIAISPWGLVEVDGASSGAAPPITELTLAEGRHQIVIRNGDYPPYTASVNVTAGQTISLRHKFGS